MENELYVILQMDLPIDQVKVDFLFKILIQIYVHILYIHLQKFKELV